LRSFVKPFEEEKCHHGIQDMKNDDFLTNTYPFQIGPNLAILDNGLCPIFRVRKWEENYRI
jgi:hypothetical protein